MNKKIIFSIMLLIILSSTVLALEVSDVKLGYQYLGEVSDENRHFVTSIEAKIQATNPNPSEPYFYEDQNFEVYVDEKQYTVGDFPPRYHVSCNAMLKGCFLVIDDNWEGKSAKTIRVIQTDADEEVTVDLSNLEWITQILCYDSDQGINYVKKGFVNVNSQDIHYDSCTGSDLTEYYCDNEEVAEVTTTCPEGCIDGACKSSIAQKYYKCINSEDGSSQDYIDLSDFPGLFYDSTGTKIDGHVVYSFFNENTISIAENIASQFKSDNVLNSRDSADQIKNPKNYNIITIGMPCNNDVSAQLKNNPAQCDDGIDDNVGYIRLFNNNGKFQIIVEAKDNDLLKLTSDVLILAQDYDLKGTEVEVRGTSLSNVKISSNNDKYEIKECFCKSGQCASGPVCVDSDDKDYFSKGFVEGLTSSNIESYYKESDKCSGQNVVEYYCEDNLKQSKEFECMSGCDNGKCKPFVEEVEVDESEKELKSSVGCPSTSCNVVSEDCVGTNKIIIEQCEVYIKKDGKCHQITSTNSKIVKDACEGKQVSQCMGCQLNTDSCIPIGTRLQKEDVKYFCNVESKLSVQKSNAESCQNSYECEINNCKAGTCAPICEGCLDENNVCIPINTRTETQYCDIDYSFKNQKSEDMSCNNNYECSTNICVNNKCISPSFIQKIMDWFKNLFG